MELAVSGSKGGIVAVYMVDTTPLTLEVAVLAALATLVAAVAAEGPECTREWSVSVKAGSMRADFLVKSDWCVMWFTCFIGFTFLWFV